MIYLILFVLLLALMAVPQLWVAHVLKKYNENLPHIPGTGAQFARHLLSHLGYNDVQVEKTDKGDHYDPLDKAVRLSADHHDKHSLAAIVVAAHEVGHAIQHHQQHGLFEHRIRLAKAAMLIAKVAPVALVIAPIFLALTRSPAISFVMLALAVLSIGVGALVHLVTLPVELDASFNKALPLLQQGQYLKDAKEQAAGREILRAAAMTYVAQALFNMLNIAYWLRILRR